MARARAAPTAAGPRRSRHANQQELESKSELVGILEDTLAKEIETVASWTRCLEDAEEFIREIDAEKAKIKKQVCESLEIFPRRLSCPLMRRAVGFNERIAESRGRVREMIEDTQSKLRAAENRIGTVRQRLLVVRRRVQYLRRKIKASG